MREIGIVYSFGRRTYGKETFFGKHGKIWKYEIEMNHEEIWLQKMGCIQVPPVRDYAIAVSRESENSILGIERKGM